MQPKDSAGSEAFKGFTNRECPFYPCHQGVRREFNCLFCYCPLIAYDCPGPYRVYTDRHGLRRKDCSACRLPHDGYHASWSFIQKWLEQPRVWDGTINRVQKHRTPRWARLKALSRKVFIR